jgi:uncharacterized protein
VKLREHEGADRFLDAASPLLLRDEARHNLMFGICATLAEAPDAYPDFRLCTLEEAGHVLGAALITPPFNLVVAKPQEASALEFLAGELNRWKLELPGVTGALPEADHFATAWEELTGVRGRPRMRHGIYSARSARRPAGVPGAMRPARADDRELLVDWFVAFQSEAMPAGAPRLQAAESIDRRLAGVGGGMMLWEDERPVSLAGFGGRTPHGVRIGPVYTPPDLRRHGYASALVADLTADLLDGGNDYCFLYTDLANPTSNRIYQNVGYEFVANSVEYAFAEV